MSNITKLNFEDFKRVIHNHGYSFSDIQSLYWKYKLGEISNKEILMITSLDKYLNKRSTIKSRMLLFAKRNKISTTDIDIILDKLETINSSNTLWDFILSVSIGLYKYGEKVLSSKYFKKSKNTRLKQMMTDNNKDVIALTKIWVKETVDTLDILDITLGRIKGG